MTSYKLLGVIALALLVGCAPKTIIKDHVVYKTRTVYVQVPCDVEVHCEFSGDGYTPTRKLMECIVKQKRAIEYCKQTHKEELK